MRMLPILIALVLALPASADAAELNAGFVQGLWYSDETFFEGEPVRIYVALRNNTDDDLSAMVRFTDNGRTIGTRAISALPGRLIEAWIDWTPDYGEHDVRADLVDVKVHPIGEPPRSVEVASTFAENARMIDTDTDGDGIGNIEDDDDDDDGITDAEEAVRGTDPLAYDEPEPEPEPEEVAEKNLAERSAVKEESDVQGLEQYTENGTIDFVLTETTERITEAKRSLDAYRERRNEAIRTNRTEMSAAPGADTSVPDDQATITRHKLEDSDTNLLSVIGNVLSTTFRGIYTATLFVLSKLLAHPALLQLALLFGLLWFIYRTARRLGARQNM